MIAKRVLIATCALMALVTVSLAPATAASGDDREGFGVTPVRLNFVDPPLIRGGSSEGNFRIQNWFSEPTEVMIRPEGDLAKWVTLEPPAPFIVAADSSRPVKVIMNVPESAANGDYSGFLRITATGTGEPNGSGAAISVEVMPALKVKVSGDQVLRFAAEKLGIKDVKDGSVVTFSADVMNRGNVRAPAAFDILVRDANGKEVANEHVESEPLAPGTRVSEVLATQAILGPGVYTAHVSLANVLDGMTFVPIEFRVLPRGVATGTDAALVEGELRALAAEPQLARVGEVVSVIAQFKNTGPVEIAGAKLTTEIYREGRRVAVIAGDALRVPAGSTVDLDGFYTPTESGAHTMKSYVTFDGMRTPVSEHTFDVAGDDASGYADDASSAKGASGQDSKTPGPGAFFVLAGVAFAAFVTARRR